MTYPLPVLTKSVITDSKIFLQEKGVLDLTLKLNSVHVVHILSVSTKHVHGRVNYT